uniref:Uncharacterized protein n=1 Tax=Anguilla anguilla TaxID=7936 RepID=A0A0E9T5F0_ANGAN
MTHMLFMGGAQVCFPGGREEFLPYSLFSTVDTPALVLIMWTRAYSSYFTSTTRKCHCPYPGLGQK